MTHRPSQPRTDSPRHLTEDRLAIRDLAREFAMERVLPVANELDPVQGTIPDSLKAEMSAMGFFGIMVPEEHGGLGLGVFEYCLVAEELSRAWMSVSGLLARGNGMGGGFTPEQEAALLPRVAAGDYLGAYALSEAEAGSDVANISCRAVRDGVPGGDLMSKLLRGCGDFLEVRDVGPVLIRIEPSRGVPIKHVGWVIEDDEVARERLRSLLATGFYRRVRI